MRPLILMPTINSRNSNACYLQLLSVQRCQHPPAAERCCWGGGPAPPSSRALLLGGGVGHGLRCAGGVPSSVQAAPRQTREQSRVSAYVAAEQRMMEEHDHFQVS